jgi:hypothetical protein
VFKIRLIATGQEENCGKLPENIETRLVGPFVRDRVNCKSVIGKRHTKEPEVEIIYGMLK